MHFCVPLPEFLIQYIRGGACISNKFPGMADAADLETTSEKHWSVVSQALCERNWCEMCVVSGLGIPAFSLGSAFYMKVDLSVRLCRLGARLVFENFRAGRNL